MDCSKLSDAISVHVAGGELDRRLRAHLAHCERCRAEVERRRAGLARIDAELASALRLEPSPEFVARVRSRVAASPARSGWVFGWRAAIAAASLALVVVAAGLSLLRGPVAPPTQPPAIARPTRVPDASAAVQPEPAPKPVSAVRRVAAPRLRAAVAVKARNAEPEVLVPASQRIAIRELMQMLRAGTLDDRILAEPREIPHSDVSVTPIVVEEVAVPAVTIRGAVERRP